MEDMCMKRVGVKKISLRTFKERTKEGISGHLKDLQR